METTSQFATTQYDKTIATLTKEAFQGLYRVRLDNINVAPIPRNRTQNVNRLTSIFKQQRCLRNEAQNHILALIDPEILEHHTSVSHSSDGVTELLMRSEDSVRCLHGSCRVVAAKAVLYGSDRWWMVRLFKTTLDQQCQAYYQHAFANQQWPSDGTIYFNLQRSIRDKDVMAVNKWQAYLTTHKRLYLRRLCKRHAEIIEGFNRLLAMETLFQSKKAFRIGVFHKLGNLHCDRYLVNYLDSLLVFCRGISHNGKYQISTEFLEAMQGRCPKVSQADHEHLQKAVDTTGLLSYLPQEARADVYQTAITYNLTFPSFYTFFEDWKYLEIICEVLQGLLSKDQKPRRDSLENSFKGLFSPTWMPCLQTGHTNFVPCAIPAGLNHFDLAFWQLFLAAMRLWPFLLVRRGRRAWRETPEGFENSLRVPYWGFLARTARELGFNSSRLGSMATTSGDADLGSLTGYSGFTSSKTCKDTERCGIPFDNSYILDRNSLFWPQMRLEQADVDMGSGRDITVLLVRRSFFIRLFPRSLTSEITMLPQIDTDSPQVPRVPFSARQVRPPAAPDTPPSTIPRHTAITRENTTQKQSTAKNVQKQYRLDILQGNNLDRRILTWNEWFREINDLASKKYTLWEPEELTSIDLNDLHQHSGRRLLAVHPNTDVGAYRQVRHTASRPPRHA